MKYAILGIVSMIILNTEVLAQDQIDGIWLTQEGNSKVEILEEDGIRIGKLVWLNNPKSNELKDKRNPDKSLRERPLLGINLLSDLIYENGSWVGKIYAPKRGGTMDVKLDTENSDKLILTVSVKGFTKEQVWTKSTL